MDRPILNCYQPDFRHALGGGRQRGRCRSPDRSSTFSKVFQKGERKSSRHVLCGEFIHLYFQVHDMYCIVVRIRNYVLMQM